MELLGRKLELLGRKLELLGERLPPHSPLDRTLEAQN